MRLFDKFKKKKMCKKDVEPSKNVVCYKRDNFVFTVSKGMVRPFYDSEWQISVYDTEKAEGKAFNIVRDDTETIGNIREKLNEIELSDGLSRVVNSIKLLDKRGKIFCD